MFFAVQGANIIALGEHYCF